MIARDSIGAETWLLSLPPTRRQTRWVVAIAACQLAALALLGPFAHIHLARINAFIPAFEGVIFVTDLVTSVLLFSQFAIYRLRALLVLACGYLFSALMIIPHALTFPGAFSRTGLLGAGSQTTGWIYWFWHLLFALALLGYALMRNEKIEPGPAQASSLVVIARSVALILALAYGLTLLATAGHDSLPVLFAEGIGRAPTTYVMAAITLLACVSALAVLGLRRRSVLDQWLMIVALAAILEIGVSIIFTPVATNARFSVAFYAGRLFSLLTSTIVLVVLLVETTRLFANLRWLNETLELRVQAATRDRLQIWNVSQDLLLIADLDGRYISINPAWTATLGWSESNLLAEMYQWLLHPDDLERTRSEFDHLVRGRKTLHFENRLRAKDGSYHWVSWAAALDGDRVYGMGRDITEQKQAQEALRVSERNLSLIINTIPTHIYVLNPEGSVRYVNQAVMDYTGLSLEDTQQEDYRDRVIHPDDFKRVRAGRAASLSQGAPFSTEQRVLDKDGQFRWFLVRYNPLLDEQGGIVRWYVAASDIEDRKRAEEALRELESALAHMNRVGMMGELAASLSHEITQPIASARNNAQAALNFLDRQQPDLGEAREALSSIVGDADRAGDIIDRIRDHIKKSPPRMGHFDPNSAINEVIALARSAINRNRISVRTQLAGGLPPVQGDRVQLQQVLLNLVLNAVEAMSAVGVGARELVISTELDPAGMLVGVGDSGPGIDPKLRERVFEAFYTTKSSGTGSGLSICRSIIDAHGGRLWVDQNEPRGAVFRFTVPGAGTQLHVEGVAEDGRSTP